MANGSAATVNYSNQPADEGLVKEVATLLKQNIREYGMYIALVVIIGIFTILTGGNFMSPRNFSNLINQTGYIAVLAVGMTLILIIKHIDLSVGFVAGFTGAIAAIIMAKLSETMDMPGLAAGIAIIVVLLVGAAIGLIYGGLVAKVGVPAFVVTLAGTMIFRGLLLLVTEGTGTIIVNNDIFNAIGNGYIPDIVDGNYHFLTLLIGIVTIVFAVISQVKTRANQMKYNFKVVSMPIFIMKLVFMSIVIAYIMFVLASYNGLSWTVVIVAAVVMAYSFLMNKTPLGRYIYGIGGNTQAAELSGVNVAKVTMFAFVSMSILAGLSGILFTSRLQSAGTTAGHGFELDAIAAAYVGGTSANGGIGKVTGSIVGALVMMSLTNGMNLMGIGVSYQYAIRGAILVAAVIFDIMTRRKKA